jgi:hypothetical protein
MNYFILKMQTALSSHTSSIIYPVRRRNIPENSILHERVFDGSGATVVRCSALLASQSYVQYLNVKKLNQSHYRPGVVQRIPGS